MMHLQTRAIHTGVTRREGGLAPAIQLSTTFVHGPQYETVHGYTYSRHANPNVGDLESRLAALEAGAGALAFSSGVAAGASLLATLPVGGVVLFHQDLYTDFRRLSALLMQQGRIVVRYADLRQAAAITPDVAMVWFESPSNPLLDVIDIPAVCAAAAAVGAKVVVDSTFASPALQTPIALGADFVLHALTKYIGGHSDVMGGAIVCRDSLAIEPLHQLRTLTGGVLSPFSAWLAARGLQTLPLRMERHSANALALATWLEAQPQVSVVRYPWLPSHRSVETARRQMKGGGGVLSFELHGGQEAAVALAKSLQLFTNATSLGGAESLVEHRASAEGPSSTTPRGLLRLSVGLEHIDDLIADLRQALASLG